MSDQRIHDKAQELTKSYLDQGFILVGVHPYTDSAGNPLFWRLRLKRHDSAEKKIFPLAYINGEFTLKEPMFNSKKPIYGLERIADAKLIFWVEGEAKADALNELGIVATTAGGATSHTKADFEPLKGKEIWIWPDNDQAGFDHANAVGLLLNEHQCSVATIDISKLDLPKGGDFIDWFSCNPSANKEQILSLPLIPSKVTVESEEGDLGDLPLPYPIDALPDSIKLAVEEVASFTKAPISMIASSALSAVSLALQSQADVGRDRNLTGPTSLFFLIVADSGERKSTVDKYFTQAIKLYEAQQLERAKPEIQEFESDMSIWSQKRNGLLNKIKNPKPKDPPIAQIENQLKELDKLKPIRPKVPQVLYQDATPEALCYDLHKVWPSGAVISAEAGIVFGSHGMGQDAVMRNLATLNILWDGGEVKINRRTQESYALIGARLTVSLQVQEPTVRNFIAKSCDLARGTGFLARFLIAHPESTQGERLYTESPLEWPHLDEFNTRVLSLLNAPYPVDPFGNLAPQLMMLSEEAKQLWIAAHNEIESKLKGELYDVRDVASKTADNISRIACLFHKFSRAEGSITAEHLEAATRISIWHLDQSRRFLSKLEKSPKEINSNRLYEWLVTECPKHPEKTINKRYTQQFGPIRDAKVLADVLKFLEYQKRVDLQPHGKSVLIKIKQH